MQKYNRQQIEALLKVKDFHFKGISKEKIKNFWYNNEEAFSNPTIPVSIEGFGITNPDPKYEICRDRRDNYILEYIISGEGHVKINDEEFDVGPGDAYLLYPQTVQHYYSNKKNPYKKYWVNFRSGEIDNILESLKIKGIHHFPNCNLSSYFQNLFIVGNDVLLSKTITFEVYQILLSAFVEMRKSLYHNSKNVPEKIIQAKQNIDQNIQSDITVEKITKELQISKTYLINAFKKAYGITPKQYIKKEKMRIAVALLSNRNGLSVKEVAFILSYNDQYHFSHEFKKHYGLSPKKYKDTNSLINE